MAQASATPYSIDYGLDYPASMSLTCARLEAGVTSKPRLSKLPAVADVPHLGVEMTSKLMILKRFRLNPRNRKIHDLYGAMALWLFTPATACPTPSRGASTSLSCTSL